MLKRSCWIWSVALIACQLSAQIGPDVVWFGGGHNGLSRAIAYSPDGLHFATGAGDGTVKLWRISDRSLVRTLGFHPDGVNAIAYSPDGQYVASGGLMDGLIKLWNVADGSLVRILGGGGTSALAFTPDGASIFATRGFDIRQIRVSDGLLLRTMTGHFSTINYLAVSPDGTTLASAVGGFGDSGVRLWRVSDGAYLSTIGGGRNAACVAFSSDSQFLVIGSQSNLAGEHGNVRLWRLSDDALIRTFPAFQGATSVSISPDGTEIYGVGARSYPDHFSGAVRWRISDGAVLAQSANLGLVSGIVAPDGGSFVGVAAAAWPVNKAYMLDPSMLAILPAANADGQDALTHHGGLIGTIVYTPDGTVIATSSYDWTVKLWNASTGALLRTLNGHTSFVTCVAASSDNSTIASGSSDGTVKLWRISDGALLTSWVAQDGGGVGGIAFSPDGTKLLTIGGAKARLWSIPGPTLLFETWGFNGQGGAVAFSPDGETMAAAGSRQLKLWRASDGSTIYDLGTICHVSSIAFSPDGTKIVAAGGSGAFCGGSIQMWRVSDAGYLGQFVGNNGNPTGIAFSPNGSTIAVGGAAIYPEWPGRELVIYCVEGHEVLNRFTTEVGSMVLGVAYSPDGGHIAYGRGDGTLVKAVNPFVNCLGDDLPPITTGSPSGTTGTNGWYISDVLVTLTAVDPPGGTGVKEIVYSLNGGPSTTVQGSSVEISITDECETAITFYARDYALNAEAPQTLTIRVDKTAPTITCPEDITVGNDPGQCYATVDLGTATATDHCSTPVISSSRSDGKPLSDPYLVGTTTITWLATDAAGNSASCTQNVTVNDVEAPVLTLPENMTVYQDSAFGATVTYNVTTTDNCDPSVTVECTPASGTVFPLGTTTVNCTATDSAGNTSTGSFTVTVVVPPSTPSAKVTGGGEIAITGGRFSFGMVEITNSNGAPRGSFTGQNHVTGKIYRSTIISSVVITGTHAVVLGKMSIDGAGEYDFALDVDDLGEPGGNVDRIRLQVSNGDTFGGTLLDGGNIQIHWS